MDSRDPPNINFTSSEFKDSKDFTALDKLLLTHNKKISDNNRISDFEEEELESYASQPDDEAIVLQRAKSSSMHQSTRPNLFPPFHFPQRGKAGPAEQADSNWAPNHHVKTMFW